MTEFCDRFSSGYKLTPHKRIEPEDYENIKMDIPLILSEAKNHTFYLGTRSAIGGGYGSLEIFLAGGQPDGSWITRHDEKMGDLLCVNLLEGGQRIGNNFGYGELEYFEPQAVKDIDRALDLIANHDIKERWALICSVNNYKSQEMTEAEVKDFSDFYQELKAYFKSVSKAGNALLLSVC